jgi:hypothetical protein
MRRNPWLFAWLSEFAIVHDIDANSSLFLNHFGNSGL